MVQQFAKGIFTTMEKYAINKKLIKNVITRIVNSL